MPSRSTPEQNRYRQRFIKNGLIDSVLLMFLTSIFLTPAWGIVLMGVWGIGGAALWRVPSRVGSYLLRRIGSLIIYGVTAIGLLPQGGEWTWLGGVSLLLLTLVAGGWILEIHTLRQAQRAIAETQKQPLKVEIISTDQISDSLNRMLTEQTEPLTKTNGIQAPPF